LLQPGVTYVLVIGLAVIVTIGRSVVRLCVEVHANAADTSGDVGVLALVLGEVRKALGLGTDAAGELGDLLRGASPASSLGVGQSAASGSIS
jgi:hypothetical protein